MNDMKTSVIVYGPTGCGKSTNAERIREHFGLASIVDDFDPIRKGCSLTGVLYLTGDSRSRKTRAKSSHVKVRDYADVMAEINAALLLTDWIPCTTPPVREGVYECTGLDDHSWRAEYRHGQWIHNDGQLMEHTMQRPDLYSWRGVRRWVLVVRGDPVLGAAAYVQKRTPTNTFWSGHLLKAKDFDAEAKAIAYRDKGRHFIDHSIEAVIL